MPENWPTKIAPLYSNSIIVNQTGTGSEVSNYYSGFVEANVNDKYDTVIAFYQDKMKSYDKYNIIYDQYDGDRTTVITGNSGGYKI